MENVLRFLSELANNNNRDWFETNKLRYTESRNKVLFMTEVLINEIRKFDNTIPALEAKNCMFRIFRDTRFSGDKRPYKTNFGSFIANGGRRSECPGYYFHLEPGKSFVGGGLYKPSSAILKAVRVHIAANGQDLINLINREPFNQSLPDIYSDQLKTTPKGFPKDHPFIDLLRNRSFTYSANIPDELLTNGSFFEVAVNAYKELHPVNSFFLDALHNDCSNK